MKLLRILFSLAILPALACTSDALAQQAQSISAVQPIGIEALLRLDLLPTIKTQVQTGAFTSYDRSGGNDDGFSGKYSYLRKEGDQLVIAEMEGPGVVTRIHMPDPQEGYMEFYLDGEKTPRISLKIKDYFDGKHLPFLEPLTGSGVGGYYTYVPISYQYSCKIMIRDCPVFTFYDLNYVKYPANTLIQTYQNPPSPEWLQKIEETGKILNSAGTDISSYLAGPGIQPESKKISGTAAPGKPLEIFKMNKPGRILGIKLGPASQFAGLRKDAVLNIYYEGESLPSVTCPVADLFGYSFGEPATKSLFTGTSNNFNYLYLPMPFSKSVRVELVQENTSGPAIPVDAEVVFARNGKKADEGYFYCQWNRENPCTTGKPFTYLNTTGNGHIIGVSLQAQGFNPGGTTFFEGDDIVMIDGEMAIHGTGSEDSFNGGWYDVPARWEERASFPLSGCLDYKKPMGRTGGYRWMIPDTYVFRRNIDYTIEHGPEGNAETTDYTSVTYYYSTEKPSANIPLPETSDRRITAPKKVVFVPGWNVPTHTTPLQNAIIEKGSVKVGTGRVRCFTLKTTNSDVFGAHEVSFILDLPEAGKYQISVKAIQGPDMGILQARQHDNPLGKPVDLYATETAISPILPMGTLNAVQGNNVVYFRLSGKNLSLIEIILELLP
jgi:hypothetical protein